jgi:hypothetical protein
MNWSIQSVRICPAAQFAKTKDASQSRPVNKSRPPEQQQILSQQPQLPQLPAYTGYQCKFLRAYTQALLVGKGKSLTMYRCHYLAKETMQQVKDWYENALRGYGWKILRVAPQIIAAKHQDGQFCTVIVNQAASSTGYRTHLVVHYSEAPPKASQS